MDGLGRKQEVTTQEWLETLENSGGRDSVEKNRLIYEHLVRMGFGRAAETFRLEAGLSEFENGDDGSAELIFGALLGGRTEEVAEYLQTNYEDLLSSNGSILLELAILEFVGLVKAGAYDRAAEVARSRLLPAVDGAKPSLQTRLKDVLSLLAFKDLGRFPKQELLGPSALHRAAAKISRLVSPRPDSQLELKQKKLFFLQDSAGSALPLAKLTQTAPLRLTPISQPTQILRKADDLGNSGAPDQPDRDPSSEDELRD